MVCREHEPVVCTGWTAPQCQTGPVDGIAVRPVRREELAAVAGLRWRWVEENEGTSVASHEEFVQFFVAWALANATSHHCAVLARGETLLGMAWLAVVPRVPRPGVLERASGDVQCVYVVPNERNSGLGGQLIDAVLELAEELGLEHVTVHSSTRAIPAYARHGFAVSPLLLHAPSPARP